MTKYSDLDEKALEEKVFGIGWLFFKTDGVTTRNVNELDSEGSSLLHRASALGAIKSITQLIKLGANIESAVIYGKTPLHIAAVNGQQAAVEQLLKAGASLKAADRDGWTPLHIAAAYGHYEVAEVLINAMAGIDVVDKDGWTPLYIAAAYGQQAVAELLLKYGAKIDAKTKDNKIPLDIAKEKGHQAIVKLLETHQANPIVTYILSLLSPEQAIKPDTNITKSDKSNSTDNNNYHTDEKAEKKLGSPLFSTQSPQGIHAQLAQMDRKLDRHKQETDQLILEGISDLMMVISGMGMSLTSNRTLTAVGMSFVESTTSQGKDPVIVAQSVSVEQINDQLTKLSLEVGSVKNDVGAVKGNVALLNSEHQTKSAVLHKRKAILQNDNLRSYYEYSQALLSSAYITAQVIVSGKVELKENSSAKVGKVIGKIVEHIPIAGVAGSIITSITKMIGDKQVTQAMHHIASVATNTTEMDLVNEAIARKMVNFLYDKLLNSAQSKPASYSERFKNWISGNPILSPTEKLAAENIQLLLTKLAQGEIKLPKRSEADQAKHAEQVADELLLNVFSANGYQTNLPDRLYKLVMQTKAQYVAVSTGLQPSPTRLQQQPAAVLQAAQFKGAVNHTTSDVADKLTELESAQIADRQKIEKLQAMSDTQGEERQKLNQQLIAEKEVQQQDRQKLAGLELERKRQEEARIKLEAELAKEQEKHNIDSKKLQELEAQRQKQAEDKNKLDDMLKAARDKQAEDSKKLAELEVARKHQEEAHHKLERQLSAERTKQEQHQQQLVGLQTKLEQQEVERRREKAEFERQQREHQEMIKLMMDKIKKMEKERNPNVEVDASGDGDQAQLQINRQAQRNRDKSGALSPASSTEERVSDVEQQVGYHGETLAYVVEHLKVTTGFSPLSPHAPSPQIANVKHNELFGRKEQRDNQGKGRRR
jgi:hypothetical protein